MEQIVAFVTALNNIVWGPPMLVLILGTGFYLQVRLKLLPIRRISAGFKLIWKSRHKEEGAKGEITPFAALMTSLAATVGTGNIAGVATAIAMGGPGALFWMWMTACVGMATKYAEVVLAVHYRETDSKGEQVGGPMVAIKNGLSKNWRWLGFLFAAFGGLAGFGIGNMVQANSVADVLRTSFGISPWISGLLMAVLTGLVLLGGIRRIGAVAEKLVPFMCIIYVAVCLVIFAMYFSHIPAALALVFKHAFTPAAATGGFSGAAVMLAIRFGVARGVFSNEAGLGTAGIAQAAGITKSSVESGLIGMMGTFIDTIIVCTMTGLAILLTGVWTSGANGAALSSNAFEVALPGFGKYILTCALAIFAYTTILGWAYCGEKCMEYLFGAAVKLPYRILWTIFVMIGAVTHLDFVWLVADTLNALMAIPNLISLILLSPVVTSLTKSYFERPSTL